MGRKGDLPEGSSASALSLRLVIRLHAMHVQWCCTTPSTRHTRRAICSTTISGPAQIARSASSDHAQIILICSRGIVVEYSSTAISVYCCYNHQSVAVSRTEYVPLVHVLESVVVLCALATITTTYCSLVKAFTAAQIWIGLFLGGGCVCFCGWCGEDGRMRVGECPLFPPLCTVQRLSVLYLCRCSALMAS